jgi:hypothetical protein
MEAIFDKVQLTLRETFAVSKPAVVKDTCINNQRGYFIF